MGADWVMPRFRDIIGSRLPLAFGDGSYLGEAPCCWLKPCRTGSSEDAADHGRGASASSAGWLRLCDGSLDSFL
eukprot:CAMPEP_0115152586 /NCGR_PEP_ID=MMETSP0227-20121206/66241_1 /TAXON_ID=89957 /ORGANISM="Polarella glacialis, Strain CCMP 1383" /LENGTH=73 /DNA_ID=CAMNT_0002563207 /DNA_START=957 /DNA_END=1175 /DNA_ORIENTATION=-